MFGGYSLGVFPANRDGRQRWAEDKIAKRKAFDELINNLKPKIEKLIRLPVATMDTVNLKFKLREIYNNDK